jgi:prophage regulatory protein
MNQANPPTYAAVAIRKALRCPKVLERTGLSKTHLYRLIQQGKFPAPHKLSERVSAWDAAAIDSWLAERFGL